jgi:gliding motility-associated-like protein
MKVLLIIFGFFSCNMLYSQLADFSLNITTTHETCQRSGSMQFSVGNVNPLSTLLYTVYKYPNLDLPISVSNGSSIGNLTAGKYKVVAAQSLNTTANHQAQDIVIERVVIPFQYTISASNQNCSTGGKLAITVTSGTAASYEIISGPVTRPLQLSNVFESLPEGTYNIRVFNDCGEGLVTTFTLLLTTTPVTISNPSISKDAALGCIYSTVSHFISAPEGSFLSYPITVQYILNPASGTPVLLQQVFTTGDPVMLNVTQQFPMFGSSSYTFTIKVNDNCSQYEKPDLLFDPLPAVTLQQLPGQCGKKYLTLTVENYSAPYTVRFVNKPDDFNPQSSNASHPGPFNEAVITYGSSQMALPVGVYEIEITDACGRKTSSSIELINDDPAPVAHGNNNGCYSLFGSITVFITSANIIKATIISTPSSRATSRDVTSFIKDGRLVLENMPLGHYVLLIVDECNVQHTVPVDVPPFVEQDFSAQTTPDCNAGFGSVMVMSNNGKLKTLAIASAPAGFNQPLPFDISNNIGSDGKLYMNGLPGGSYTFKGKDECGIERSIAIVVEGYQPDQTPFLFTPRCGSFDLDLNDASLTSAAQYWLQQLDTNSGKWSHPATGASYTDGTVPDESDAIRLANNKVKYNINYSGTFRVLKVFKSFNNGTESKICIEDIGEFNYGLDLKISNAYSLACTGNPHDVYIEAVNGLQPYIYKIVKKDGVPFVVNNGSNNIFTDLQPGTYSFEVYDSCGNVAPAQLNINVLPSLVTAHKPADNINCIGASAAAVYQFNLRSNDAAILGAQNLGMYTITYHLSEADANSNTDALPDIFTSTAPSSQVFARVAHKSILICHAVVSFNLIISKQPVLLAETQYYLCSNTPITITAPAGLDFYRWSTGEITRSIALSEPGNYTLTAGNSFGASSCESTIAFTVSPSSAPVIREIKAGDWTEERNSITVVVEGKGNYEFSLDAVNYQDSNVFENLATGVYNVYVRDKNRCGETAGEVVLLNYPKFFTPNHDGINDKWRIKFSMMEPALMVYIYDRYGKLITGFDGNNEGWDGTLNGRHLPSTDYWFVVKRQDGRELKGHFSMIR